jgi:hypothetical protein
MPGMGHSGAARAGMLNLTQTGEMPLRCITGALPHLLPASLEWAPVRTSPRDDL